MHAGALEEWSTDVTSEAVSVVPWSIQPVQTRVLCMGMCSDTRDFLARRARDARHRHRDRVSVSPQRDSTQQLTIHRL